MQNHVLVANVIGFHGILRYKIEEDGGSFIGREQTPLLSSTDPNFRPTDLKIAPDGSLYFVDWHNPIIGHMQHNLRDPSRDREHGRIYRLTHTGNALLKPPVIEGESIEKLLALLKTPEDRIRYRVRIELGKHDSEKVGMEVSKWLESLKPSEEDFDRLQLEGLWLLQSHNLVNPKVLKLVLSSNNPLARAAATRIISYWHDRLPDALDLLRTQAADSHPRVRLEAVRAASFLNQPEAMEVVLIATEKPQDRYIEFVREETMRALQPIVKKAIADGKKIQFTTSTGARYFLRNVSTDDLLKMERSPAIYLELLFRNGVRDEFRREALAGLAKFEKKNEVKVLLDAIKDQDSLDRSGEQDSVFFDLARLLASRPQAELQSNRENLEKLATSARKQIFRELGYVTLMAADGSSDKTWNLAKQSASNLTDFVRAIPMIGDPGLRASLFPHVAGLMDQLPKELTPGGDSPPPLSGRYIRIELPGKYRTLTLAEVEVYSDGENLARKGKAYQASTSFGGNAKRAIDGNRSGSFADGGQTHTEEGVTNPWWELDLGRDVPIQSLVIFNRTDGNLGSRLTNFGLKVLDSKRREVYAKEKNPAPKDKSTFILGNDSPLRRIRRAAMLAIPTMRGRETEAVNTLSRFLKDEADRSQVVSALQRIPPQEWPKEKLRPAIDDLLTYVRKVPVKDRTQVEVVDALQLADGLSVQLPPEQAQSIRKELSELGVRVIRLGTVIEQMRYDQDRIVVQAGKPFEILFENTDTMPHNLVFVKPGSLEEIGDLAEKTSSMPGAMDRGYVPVSPKILLSSNLIQPRQMQRISWTAPSAPGIYPFVCTYPGHWRRMNGAMYVVEDLEAYLSDPEGYLKKTTLTISDELLKFNRPRKEWKFEELESVTKKLEGRSFANGKQMFSVGSCISCHKFGGSGQEYGPDLTKMDPKWNTQDVMKHILEPSLKIDDKYRTWILQIDNG
ncbi:MAG: HEAT repeat domain-containing protein, partial [Gemmataceae bacterium]